MVNLQRYIHLNGIFSCCTLVIFSSTAIASPPPVYEAGVLNLAVVGVRVKKLIDKFEKYRDLKDSDKLISVMLDIKYEAEQVTGKKN
jgi:hypothetical protein